MIVSKSGRSGINVDMITLHPDKIKVRGPNVDGGWSVTLEIGEYEKVQVAQLVVEDELPIVEFKTENE